MPGVRGDLGERRRRRTGARQAVGREAVRPVGIDNVIRYLSIRHVSDSSAASTEAVEALIQRCLQRRSDSPGTRSSRQCWRKVFNVAYKFVGKHDEAEDLTQDIFLKIFKSLDTFDRRANFQTWLISISRNLCIDHYRSVRKERETIDRGVDARRADAGVARRRADARRSSSAIASCLLRAGDVGAARHAAHRGADARHPGAVVSGNRRRACSCPEGTVKSRINRGRTELARQIRKLRSDEFSTHAIP